MEIKFTKDETKDIIKAHALRLLASETIIELGKNPMVSIIDDYSGYSVTIEKIEKEVVDGDS